MAARARAAEKAENREIVITRVFDAPRELVFDAWTDPKHVPHWWGPNGFTITVHEMDVRPGGVWRFIMHGPDGVDYPNRIVYDEIARPERLVYTHGGESEDDPAQFQTTVTFAEQGAQTRLTMRALFRSAADRDRVVKEYGAIEGGNQTLARLAEHLAKIGSPAAREAPQREYSMAASNRAAEIAAEWEFVITRVFDAPRELVFQAWTECEHLQRWFGPKGFAMFSCENDLRPGGAFHYGLRAPRGEDMWGKWVYREIVPPERLVFIGSFSDPEGRLTRHSMAPNWPLETLTTLTFAEHEGRTTLTLRAVPHGATESEGKTFKAGHDSMRGGWGGTLDQLVEHLAKM